MTRTDLNERGGVPGAIGRMMRRGGSPAGDAASAPRARDGLAEARNAHLALSLRPIALGMIVLYSALTPSHLLLLEGAARTVMALLAGSSVVIAALAFAALRRPVPQRSTHPIAVALIGLTLLNSLVQLGVTGSLHETTNVMLLLAGTGSLLLSHRWFVAFVVVALSGWVGVAAPLAADPSFTHWAFAIAISLVLATVLHSVRMKSVTRFLVLRRKDRLTNRALREATAASERSNRKLQGVLDSSLDGILVLEVVRDERNEIADFRHVEANRAATDMLQRPEADLLGRRLLELFPSERERLFQDFIGVVESGESRQVDVFFPAGQTASGEDRWYHVSIVPLGDGVVVTFSNITLRKEYERSVERLAHHDPLTGLLNRRAFSVAGEAALGIARRERSPLTLLLFDLDRFKPINDTHGHAAGDEVLREVARRLSHGRRDGDVVGRLGGDEFVMLLPGTDERGADEVCRRVQAQLERPVALSASDRLGAEIGASIGAATFPGSGRTLEELLRRADASMYEAKSARGGRRRESHAI